MIKSRFNVGDKVFYISIDTSKWEYKHYPATITRVCTNGSLSYGISCEETDHYHSGWTASHKDIAGSIAEANLICYVRTIGWLKQIQVQSDGQVDQYPERTHNNKRKAIKFLRTIDFNVLKQYRECLIAQGWEITPIEKPKYCELFNKIDVLGIPEIELAAPEVECCCKEVCCIKTTETVAKVVHIPCGCCDSSSLMN